MNYEKIGKFIQEKRKELNLTQLELAKKLHVTDKAVSKWERGLGCPDVSILEILAKELNVSVLELLKGRNIENEVISVTDADDYIKDAIYESDKNNYEKYKKSLNLIIGIMIIFLSLFIIVKNIKGYMFLSKEYEFISTEDKKIINDKIDTLGKNITKLKKINKKGEYTEIIELLDKFYLHYEESKSFSISKTTLANKMLLRDIEYETYYLPIIEMNKYLINDEDKYNNFKNIQPQYVITEKLHTKLLYTLYYVYFNSILDSMYVGADRYTFNESYFGTNLCILNISDSIFYNEINVIDLLNQIVETILESSEINE